MVLAQNPLLNHEAPNGRTRTANVLILEGVNQEY